MRLPLLAALLASPLSAGPTDCFDLIATNRDQAVSARQDFWLHANGRWNQAHPVPADRAVYNSFAWQDDLIKQDLLAINAELLAKPDATGDQRRLADFWRSALGFESGPAELPARLRAVLGRLDQATTPQALLDAAAELYAEGTGTFLGVFASQDKKDETRVALHLWQTGLSLPERAFYFSEEPATKRVREAFPAHVARMLGFLGYEAGRARQAGAAVLAFETKLAEASLPMVRLRDPDAHYHPMTWAEIDALTPGLRWEAVTRRAGAPAVTRVIVGQPDFLKALARILAATPAQDVRDYLRFQAISGYASVLNAATAAAAFEFEGVVMTGAKQPRSLPERALKMQDGALGDLLGKEYVARRFTPAQRERFHLVCENVRAAFAARIRKLGWMDAETQAWALRKLAAIKLRVGYPDKFRGYEGVEIRADGLAQNLANVSRWSRARAFARVGGAPEREEWGMRPYTVNAYYSPLNNEIVMPAAILAVPTYGGDSLDDAVLYGFIACTIGHELTHGFDDSGRRFGPTGRLEQGWSPPTEKGFRERCDRIVAQFDREEPLPGIRVNGKLTLGENIADLGGVEIALDAFRTTEAFRSGRLVAGQTPLQRFFLAHAFAFAGNIRPETLRNRLLSDTHSPMPQRINVVLRNVDAFHEAFGTKPGDGMWLDPAERVKIW
jgi:putative endopeptidase